MPSDSLRTSQGKFVSGAPVGKRSKYRNNYRNPTNLELDLSSDRGLAVSGSWLLCTTHGIVPVIDFSHNQMRLGCGCCRPGTSPRTQLHREFNL
jgi:hypothetical protein